MSNDENEWLNLQYSKYLDMEIFFIMWKKNYPLWKLFEFTKSRKVALFIGQIQYTQSKMLVDYLEENNKPYDEILNSCYNDIINVIKKYNLCDILENVKLKNVRGFDFFNATAFPCFGENLLAINTGVFFLSHTLVRSTEILLRSKAENKKISYIYKLLFFKQFIKASMALICQDHTKTFFKIRFFAENDSLLTGIELFCIAHEYSHLLFRKINYEYEKINFNKYYNYELVDLIYSNQEIAADAFALIILKHYQLSLCDYSIAIYSPQFLFKNLSNYDQIKNEIKSNFHPTNFERYEYIKKMINQNKFDIFDNELDIIWNKCKNKIHKKCIKYEDFVIKSKRLWNEIRNIIINKINVTIQYLNYKIAGTIIRKS